MRQNITVSLDVDVIQQARELAAQRHLSISGLLAETLTKQVSSTRDYQQAKRDALAMLAQAAFDLGGDYVSREQAHAR
jgi:post-segregation antitoxin (ccd killing protein)